MNSRTAKTRNVNEITALGSTTELFVKSSESLKLNFTLKCLGFKKRKQNTGIKCHTADLINKY